MTWCVLRLLFASVGLLSLTGCNPFWGLAPSSATIQDRGWAWVDEKPEPDPIVCYNTLGQVQCQAHPTDKAIDAERRIG